ncbi:uncharacterized protein LOC124197333 isoform X2 [Daphnia pulex]|uniref:uncharacterized protein LOC124197333 isoform X2 n=1 Tax=Daphnia pulex TaxID=6669 RepID=UPI001EDCBF33|nr:uncharacterized protein LOC124197333 isoform X2 [Daphnia pulex]
MAPVRVPELALETAKEELKAFVAKPANRDREKWKGFAIINADENMMQNMESATQLQESLLSVMETKCIVCQGQKGAIFCRITYTSALNAKEKLANSRFKPPFYFVVFPNETVFYCIKKSIPDMIADTLIKVYGATRLRILPLEGNDFRSLRQLHLNKISKGKICRRPVKTTHPIDADVEMKESHSDLKEDIEDEDRPWKKRKDEYYSEHFYPEKDPVITKFTVSSSSKFSGTRTTSKLKCDLKVTLRSDNLLEFFNYSLDKGILTYPLNPFFENIVNLGRTSISTKDIEEN